MKRGVATATDGDAVAVAGSTGAVLTGPSVELCPEPVALVVVLRGIVELVVELLGTQSGSGGDVPGVPGMVGGLAKQATWQASTPR